MCIYTWYTSDSDYLNTFLIDISTYQREQHARMSRLSIQLLRKTGLALEMIFNCFLVSFYLLIVIWLLSKKAIMDRGWSRIAVYVIMEYLLTYLLKSVVWICLLLPWQFFLTAFLVLLACFAMTLPNLTLHYVVWPHLVLSLAFSASVSYSYLI